ncbi:MULTISPECIES: hypothetical protein [Mycolicibacter]|uniref:Uncharacterized protein n=2 Tax=Mycolicibacter TaxID=1073531 RepID=A0ABU5XMD1_9MYCO|nr:MULTISPECIES: hypothetical protein [unclassified Mycolicibacter]MEB3023425.1 hypothetical protein [Mycolicibacter sp. MYC098]MEB3033767.1 hypothetical protein [Mycolicibacter sp. MYC340]
MTTLTNSPLVLPQPVEIDGGWCIKILPDKSACIDVLKMLYNYRIVLAPRRGQDLHVHPETYSRGYCYFGHGVNAAGQPRSMENAFFAAMAAAAVWDGTGDPPGYDKRAI